MLKKYSENESCNSGSRYVLFIMLYNKCTTMIYG